MEGGAEGMSLSGLGEVSQDDTTSDSDEERGFACLRFDACFTAVVVVAT